MAPSLELAAVGGRHRFAPGDQITVGRSPGCTVVVEHPAVSRTHIVIRTEPGTGWIALDDSSKGGTFLDGRRVRRIVIDRPIKLRLAHPQDGPTLDLQPVPLPGEPPLLTGDQLGAGLAGPGSFHRSQPVGALVRIGRAPDNDLVIADDLTVSRHDAELRQSPRGMELVDLDSRAGTFLDGRRVTRGIVAEDSIVGIGRHLFVFRQGRLDQYVDDRAAIVASDVTVTVRGGRRLLDRVSFAVEPGQMVAVVGPTGAGKSTLLKALTGFAPATGGTVSYNGRDLRSAAEELRSRIGYVPQDDILHLQLPLRQALRYSAELRFADDTSRAERASRVDEVLAQLGLTDRADLPIGQLSGGQRKRASVAVELLTRPALLFLDEPTSGLDPGFERSVMRLLRDLADQGHTVVVITHSVASLDLCDRVLFLAPGGRMAYYGPPGEALSFFEAASYADVFQRLNNEHKRDWPAELRAHRAWGDYVATPIRRAASLPRGRSDGHAPTRRSKVRRWRQLRTLVRRNIAVLGGSRSYAVLLIAQAPLIAALILLSVGVGNLDPAGNGKPRALLLVLMVAAVAMGLVNACREIVKELAIYRRERTVGLSPSAYIISKFLFLGVLAAAQAAFLTVAVVSFQSGGPGRLASLGLVVFLVTFAAVAVGLAISAIVATDAAALVLVPVVIVAQIVLANGMFDVESRPGLAEAAWMTPSYWGFASAAAATDLLTLDRTCRLRATPPPTPPPSAGQPGPAGGADAPCSERWKPGTVDYAGGTVPLGLLVALFALATPLALRRRDGIRT